MKHFDISGHEEIFDKITVAFKNFLSSYEPSYFEKLGNEYSLTTQLEYPEHDIFLELEINIGKTYKNTFVLVKTNEEDIFEGSVILGIYSPSENETKSIIENLLPEYFVNPTFFPSYSRPPLLLHILNYNTSKNPYLIKGFYNSATKLHGPETDFLTEIFLTNNIQFTINLEEYDWEKFKNIVENDAISPVSIENSYIPFFIKCYDVPVKNPIEPPMGTNITPSLNYDRSQLENICKYIIPATKNIYYTDEK